MNQTFLFWLLLSLIPGFAIAADDGDENDLHSQVPPPLKLQNFDKTLKEGYHVVEFFSPYCHHCKQLFPTWVEFYQQNEEKKSSVGLDEEKKTDGYKIHQVDCIASGDLCDREGIQYFPAIRFYGPKSKLLGSMTDSTRNLDTLNSFANEQYVAWADGDHSDSQDSFDELYNHNKEVNVDELTKIISGDIDVPIVISFWPTSHNQLNDENFQSDFKQNKVFSTYKYLHAFRNLLNLSMKRMQSFISIGQLNYGYFNCKSNKEVCKSLGFDSLLTIKGEVDVSPEIVLYLPKSRGGNAIQYKSKFDNYNFFNLAVKSLSHWIYRTLVNSEFEDLKFNDIKNFIGAPTKLNSKGSISEFTDFSKVAFVLVNDPDSEVPEDNTILDHLLQPISDLESDVYLLKTSDKENVLKFIREQEEYMYNQYIHIDQDNKDDIKFDEQLYIARTHTAFPFMLCIKPGSLYSPVYTSFMSKDVRDPNKVLQFIKQNYLPIINNLSINSKKDIFPQIFDESNNDKTEKVLITLTDFQSRHFFDLQFYMSYIYHKITYLNNKATFKFQNEKRKEKYEKAKGASTDDSIDILSEHVDVSYTTTENKIYPVYIDIAKFPEFVSEMRWTNIDPDNYKVGDAILVGRFNSEYWDEFNDGSHLNMDKLDETVNFIDDVNIRGIKGKKLANISIILKVLYFSGITLIVLFLIRFFKRWSQEKKLHVERMKGLGILGITSVSEESKFD